MCVFALWGFGEVVACCGAAVILQSSSAPTQPLPPHPCLRTQPTLHFALPTPLPATVRYAEGWGVGGGGVGPQREMLWTGHAPVALVALTAGSLSVLAVQGTALMHEPHAFPARLLGPVLFLWHPSAAGCGGTDPTRVLLWLHPLLLPLALSVLLQEVASDPELRCGCVLSGSTGGPCSRAGRTWSNPLHVALSSSGCVTSPPVSHCQPRVGV